MILVRRLVELVVRLVRRIVSGLARAGVLAEPVALPRSRSRVPASGHCWSARWRVDMSGRR